MLPPERRLPSVRALVDQKAYFALHAPRQVGKTTSLGALARALTAEGRYAALLVSVEVGSASQSNPERAEQLVLASWLRAAQVRLPPELRPPPIDHSKLARYSELLTAWAQHCPRPLVLFIDEVDSLQGEALLALLRQLREGYADRPESFPWSLALIGMRDVRDYKVASGGSGRLHTASPFNILAESLTMREFTADEVGELYAQHTADTGQVFEPAAVARAFELTQGQPWLVNALARQAVEVFAPSPATPITAALIDRAKEQLILRQDAHLDSLADRLSEARVRAVIGPILAGGLLPALPPDDLRFVIDLGLLRQGPNGPEVANPIYREVIPRALASELTNTLPELTSRWLSADGQLDVGALRSAFLSFWTEHGELLQSAAPYAEIAPHLVLMAFLHRVVNGGGRIEREYALGRRRLDLLVDYRGSRLAVEVKTWRETDDRRGRNPVTEGLAQLELYAARAQATASWLVVFDQREASLARASLPTSELATTPGGREVVVIRV